MERENRSGMKYMPLARNERSFGLVLEYSSYLSTECGLSSRVRSTTTWARARTRGTIELTNEVSGRRGAHGFATPPPEGNCCHRRHRAIQPNLSATAATRPPLLVQAAAATARGHKVAEGGARANENEARARGNAKPMIPSMLCQQRA